MTDKELIATDLMIGDWVNVTLEGETFKGRVTSINGDTEDIKISLYTAPLGWEDGDDFEEIEPIPLTPEILKKNGWHKAKQNGSYDRKCMRLDGLKELPEGVDNALSFAQWCIDPKFEYHLLDIYMWKGCVMLWIEYVHQLQHALRLCGIDKEIVL